MRRAALGGLVAGVVGGLAAGAALAAQPPRVQAFAIAPGGVSVSYQHAGGDGVRAFRLEREGAPQVLTSAHLADTFTVLGLQAGADYRFRVCAAYDDAAECSGWALVRTMAAPSPSGPPVPPEITAVRATVNSVTVAWGAVDGRYRKILVRIEDLQGGSQQRDLKPVPNRAWTFQGLRPGASYRVLVKGCVFSLNGGCYPWSRPVPITTPQTGPPHPASLRSLRSGGGLCLDVHAPDMHSNGARVQAWSCNGAPQQRWVLVGSSLRNASGKCLDVHAPDMRNNGARVQVWDCNGSPQQAWRVRGAALVNGGGKCLDVRAPDMRNDGARVQVWDCNASPQQGWAWTP